jgi:BirA family biotin operon repressor/biotin-[acetyl-CoA-carboxylase] ligase
VTSEPPPRPPLDQDRLAALIAAPGSLWRQVDVLERSPSTNAALAARARAGATEGLVLVAEHQTAGRGRLDRVWVTPPRAALTLSMLLSPQQVPGDRWPWLPLLVGVGVAEGVRRATGVACALKWPNDVQVGEQKLAGILVERVDGPAGAAAVAGVGLNATSTRDELPVPAATSLALQGADVDRTALLAAVLDEVAAAYASWRDAGGDAAGGLHAAYTRLCGTLGQQVRVDLPHGEQVTGEAVGVDEAGHLLVSAAGGVRVIGAGDVVHVRVT